MWQSQSRAETSAQRMSQLLRKGPVGVKTRGLVAVEGTVLKPCPGQAGLDGSTAHTACCVFQDELSHINARLNMGILGCECPRGPRCLPRAGCGGCPGSPPGCSDSSAEQQHCSPSLTWLSFLQPMILSRSSSARGPLWATRAPCGVCVCTP